MHEFSRKRRGWHAGIERRWKILFLGLVSSNGGGMEVVGDTDGQFGYEGAGAVHTGGWHSFLKVIGPCVNISAKKIPQANRSGGHLVHKLFNTILGWRLSTWQ
jgi:hypothetical protein